MLEAHWNLFSLTKLSADELSVNESDTDGVSFTENKHELQNWKRKMPKEKSLCAKWKLSGMFFFCFFFYLGSIFPSTLLPSFNLFPIYLQRWHFQSFGDVGNSSGETTEARTDGKQWYKMCIGIFQSARGRWGCWWEIILACFKDALPPLLDRFKCGNTSEWKTPWASESEWLRFECWKCHVLAMCP